MSRVSGKKFVVVIVAVLFNFAPSFSQAANGAEILVDTGFVREKIGQPGWTIVDMRYPEEYAAGHIPGAVLLPGWISKLYADDTKRSATVISRLEQQFGEMGISNDSHVILYGEPSRTSWNGVMFWVLEMGGCNSGLASCTVQLYDGGIERWQQEGGELEEKENKGTAAIFKMTPGTNRGVNMEGIKNVIEGKDKAVIVDVRFPGEYEGTDIRALRGGHIPGAVNIDFSKNYDADSYRMLPVAGLKPLYADIPMESRVITHCQTGQRAAYSYLVLRTLGYTNVAIYHDGWRVYGSNLSLPVEGETWFDFTKVNSTMKAVQELKDELE